MCQGFFLTFKGPDNLPTSTVFKEGLPVKMYTGNSNFFGWDCYCRFIAAIESQPLKHTVCIVKFLFFCQFAETNLSNDLKDVKI